VSIRIDDGPLPAAVVYDGDGVRSAHRAPHAEAESMTAHAPAAHPPTAAGLLVGAVLNGRWKLLRLLGEGGMGAVYESDDLRSHQGRRAVKMLHPEFVKEEQILQRFFAEAQACAGLVHPNIARVESSATAEDGTPYLVMELLQGIPLAAYLDQGQPIPPHQAAPIIHGVLSALQLAHSQRIVHRDLKPDNLFLVRDQRGAYVVKVLDFGIAKVMDAAGGMGSKTRTGVLLGTPGYMSPEQIRNSKGVDPRSDLWSVGIILYEMLTAKQPFPADNEFARLTAVLTEDVTPIERVAPHLAAWTPFFQRALAKNLNERFQSADEMSHALAMVARGGALSPNQAPPPVQAPPEWHQGVQLGSGAPVPSAPVAAAAVPTHVSAPKPPGTPTMSSHVPQVAIVDAPPLSRGAPYWLVAVVGLVGAALGFVLGFLVAGG
jgi:serine/threonine-protein kinase